MSQPAQPAARSMESPSKTPAGTPAADIDIDQSLVRALLRDQHPDLANGPLEPMEAGWDNAMFRLADRFTVRLPRRRVAARLIETEQRWLRALAPKLPLPVPAPIRIGQPNADYPWSWSIAPWLSGQPADLEPPRADQAESLAEFLKALHAPAPAAAPINPVRGIPLEGRTESIEERWSNLAALHTYDELLIPLRDLWEDALGVPIDLPSTWIHGDLHARNVLVWGGSISGVIDWGDMAQGDPATDLASLFMLLPSKAARQRAMDACDTTKATWRRALGWAIYFGLVLLDSGVVDHPRHAAMGELTLRRVLEGPH